MNTESPERYIILVADPDDNEWSIILETKSKESADSFWDGMEGDPSRRIKLFTGDFITFPVEEIQHEIQADVEEEARDILTGCGFGTSQVNRFFWFLKKDGFKIIKERSNGQ